MAEEAKPLRYDPEIEAGQREVLALRNGVSACETDAQRCDELIKASKLTPAGEAHMLELRTMYLGAADLLRANIAAALSRVSPNDPELKERKG